VGLAKREETIVFPDDRPPLEIPRDHPGLRLLQRLRDEAHRFANTYNADLRSRRIRESLLDDLAGLGPVRRAALMGRFGSIGRLRGATIAEISEVAGFGPKLASQLHSFLAGTRAPAVKTP
jgi:excinuclease ABC subunit C